MAADDDRINPDELDIQEKVVHINRVSKVVKGGRRFSFSAVVVAGDMLATAWGRLTKFQKRSGKALNARRSP